MTLAAKITYSLALLIGFSVGAFLGFRNIAPIFGFTDIRQTAATNVLFRFSYLEYKHADYEHAKAALQISASFLEELENVKTDVMQRRDLALIYLRLASLEEAANHPEQSSAYISKARFWYRGDSNRTSLDSEMKAVLKTVDAMNEQSW